MTVFLVLLFTLTQAEATRLASELEQAAMLRRVEVDLLKFQMGKEGQVSCKGSVVFLLL